MEQIEKDPSSLEFMITDQGGSHGCKTCRTILRQGKYVVYVRYNQHQYFRLGTPLEKQPTCCGEKKNVMALFDSYKDATLCTELYQEVFKNMPVDAEVTTYIPLLSIDVKDVPLNILNLNLLSDLKAPKQNLQ